MQKFVGGYTMRISTGFFKPDAVRFREFFSCGSTFWPNLPVGGGVDDGHDEEKAEDEPQSHG